MFDINETMENNEAMENNTVETVDENAELSFEQLLEDSLLTLNTGDRVKVTIVSIGPTEIQVDLGTKHTAYIPISELSDDPKDVYKRQVFPKMGMWLCFMRVMTVAS